MAYQRRRSVRRLAISRANNLVTSFDVSRARSNGRTTRRRLDGTKISDRPDGPPTPSTTLFHIPLLHPHHHTLPRENPRCVVALNYFIWQYAHYSYKIDIITNNNNKWMWDKVGEPRGVGLSRFRKFIYYLFIFIINSSYFLISVHLNYLIFIYYQ